MLHEREGRGFRLPKLRLRRVGDARGEIRIELRHFSSVVWRYRWLVVATTLAAVAIALGLALISATQYEARTTLRLTTLSALSSGNVRPDDIEYTERLQNTYAELLGSRQLRQQVRERLGLAERPDVRAEPRPSTELFEVVATAATRAQAVEVADAAAALLLERVTELGNEGIRISDSLFEQRIAELESQLAQNRGRRRALVGKKNPALVLERRALTGSIRASEAALVDQRAQYERERLARGERSGTLAIVAPAELPRGPAGPSPASIAIVGALIGLVAGIAAAFVLENLRPARPTAREIEDMLQVPVLGRIPAEPADGAHSPVDPSVRDDAFRHLRTTLLANLDVHGKGAMLLTGTGEALQHTRVAESLARSLAEGGGSVVLVDGNLRRTMDTAGAAPGLVDALERRHLPNDIVQRGVADGVSFLSSGYRDERAVELLASDAMREVVAALKERFDVVLVVGPSLDGTADALALAAATGAVVVVVDKGDDSMDVVRGAREQLGQVHARLLGFVVHGRDDAHDQDLIPPPHLSPGGRGVEYA